MGVGVGVGVVPSSPKGGRAETGNQLGRAARGEKKAEKTRERKIGSPVPTRQRQGNKERSTPGRVCRADRRCPSWDPPPPPPPRMECVLQLSREKTTRGYLQVLWWCSKKSLSVSVSLTARFWATERLSRGGWCGILAWARQKESCCFAACAFYLMHSKSDENAARKTKLPLSVASEACMACCCSRARAVRGRYVCPSVMLLWRWYSRFLVCLLFCFTWHSSIKDPQHFTDHMRIRMLPP